ncbi:unnamed protein product [Owenia fusiformis]|uniref:Uncharacterized protein n=1 Tax=Owenia fusiformis TaxID=6347 RepID=A0A8J1U570_OWEFU|nr:unnamed protein product [Owenia fusiformis]
MFDIFCENVLFSALVSGSLVKLSALYLLHKNRIKNAPIVGKVAAIFVYPIKSCKGIKVEQAEVTWEGLKWNGIMDRHWMIMSAEGKTVTARTDPTLVLVEPSIHGDSMHLDAPGMPTIKVPTHPSIEGTTCYQVKIWDHFVRGVCCGQEAADWFSKYLNKPVRLLHLHPKLGTSTMLDGASKFDKWARPWDKVAFSDYCPYMFISEASLQDLNSRLENPVSMDRFRTNLIMSDVSKAYDEDTWRTAFIDDVHFTFLKEGTRCIFITIDPEKGEKDKAEQPLKMLRSYRLQPEVYGNSPCFGINMVPDSVGTIRVGDPIRAYTN